MEDMSNEIMECIIGTYDDGTQEGKELTRDCLFWLFHNTDNSKVCSLIQKWFDDEVNNYCIDCGSKMETFRIEETHTELDGNPIEYLYESKCPVCD